MFRARILITIMSCTILMCGSSGCATFDSPFGKKIPKATAANPVVQILCLWQPGEGSDPDGRPCKGFSGQILFLSHHAATPVQIDGSVRVYLFDDQGTAEEQAKPLRVYEFDSGSWDVHLANSSLGPTYSVFIPYTRRGITDANCSLRVRLKPKQGPIAFSDFSNMSLNGSKKIQKGDDAKPFSEEELNKTTTDAMTNVLRRTTTISMDSNPKTSESIREEKKPTTANPIQLATHQTQEETPSNSADAERIKKLEAMVQQLLEQKSNPARAPGAFTPATVPTELNPEQMSPADEPNRSRQIRMRRHDDREAASPSRRSHPLDDEPEQSNTRTDRRSPETWLGSAPRSTEPSTLPGDSWDTAEPYRRSTR